MDLWERLAQGRVDLARSGQVRPNAAVDLPFIVVDAAGDPVEPVGVFLRDLYLGGARAATCRSYAHDLLRWFRVVDCTFGGIRVGNGTVTPCLVSDRRRRQCPPAADDG